MPRSPVRVRIPLLPLAPRLIGFLVAVAAAPAFGQAQPAAAGAAAGDDSTQNPFVSPRQVDAALKKAADFLWSQQKPHGGWEVDPKRVGDGHDFYNMQGDTYGGYTAIATYALLSNGTKPTDPRMVKAIDFLKRSDIVGTYALSVRCQVWRLIPTEDAKRLLKDDTNKLRQGVGRDGTAVGMWHYLSGPAGAGAKRGTQFDHSVSQFGILGLWAAGEVGMPIPVSEWKLFDQAWRAHQFNDGGWTYNGTGGESGGTPAMTAAGVASLFIIQDMLGPGSGSWCQGNGSDPKIEAGLRWVGDHWSGVDQAYTLYGIERIGAASGYKYFGAVDWFNNGAALMVQRQQQNGAWTMGGQDAVSDTALCMLFLSHGRAPVLVNKLNYGVVVNSAVAGAGKPKGMMDSLFGTGGTNPSTQPSTRPGGSALFAPPTLAPNQPPAAPPATAPAAAPPAPAAGPTTRSGTEAPWNQRPRDVANLVSFVGKNTERTLHWQIVSLAASVDELHDAPLLYLSGNKPLAFTLEEDARLRQFIEQGGMVLANADCPTGAAADPFVRSVVDLGHRLFGYKFRPLPPNHVILTEQQFKSTRWKDPPTVLGLSNGVRELIVLVATGDPGRAWQKNLPVVDPPAFELGADVCLYSVDKQNLRLKGQTYLVRQTKAATRTIRVARLQAGDTWNPEPGGWRRLDAIMHNDFAVALRVDPIVPAAGKLTGYHVAHLTGTTAFALTPDQRAEIKRFVSSGGTLVVDAAGGAPAFADAAEKELAAMFGGTANNLGRILPPEDRLYTLPGVAGAQIAEVDYRNYMRRHWVGRLDAPRVRGIDAPGQAGRVGVLYSREDLSGGMVGQAVDGITGYTPDSATAVMRNALLYAGGK